jgi:sulfur carrier protein
MADAATIRVNGRSEPLQEPTVAALLATKNIDAEARGVAVALNGAVVPRRDWPTTPLNNGDDVEIVRALRGG